jgi:acetate kinase
MNRGSATLKSVLYECGERDELILSITIDQEGSTGSWLKIKDHTETEVFDSPLDRTDSNAALKVMFQWLDGHGHLSGLAAAGHRIVQGGSQYNNPQRITAKFLTEIEKLVPLDPDHLPAAIRGIQFIAKKFPELPQVACFDTAFHKSLPAVARMYALPGRLYDQGIFRHGFHGLSYEYIMSELRMLDAKLAAGRVIIAHLGSGASMVAVKDGKSIDTSMGFTPLEGLVMATRSGDVDPGILLYLLQERKVSVREINSLVNKESGLLGVSETSGDMRVLLKKMQAEPKCAEAVDLFCYRAKKYVGAYAAALGGLDVLVFAGGIGENAPVVRKRICDGLDFLGIRLDDSRNDANADLISLPDSLVKVRLVKTNEDLMILRHVRSLLGWRNA